MAYPPGISLAVIQAGKAGTFFGDAASLTATVTPVLSGTKYLVHSATGDLMVPSPMTFTASNDSVLSFSVPHVDQAGYMDDNATPYTMWAYKVDVTVLIGNGRQVKKHTWTKNFQPLVGQDFIDIDQIASGTISEGVTAPLPEILSVNGQTGHVTVEAGANDVQIAGLLQDDSTATGSALKSEFDAVRSEADAKYLQGSPDLLSKLPTPFYVAHRAGANVVPEQSMEGFRVMAATGIDVLEADIQPTGDGALVAMHDATVDRTTDGSGPVSDYSLPSFLSLNAAAKIPWPRVSPPATLQQMLAEFGPQKVLQIEPKDPATLHQMLDAVEAARLENSIMVETSNLQVATEAVQRGYTVWFFWGATITSPTVQSVLDAGVQHLAASRDISDADAQALVATGRPVTIYGVDRRKWRDRFLALGVKGISSDNPVYVKQNRAFRKRDSWRDGMWGHGLATMRAKLPRIENGAIILEQHANFQEIVVPGEVCPIANAAGTYTIDVDLGWKTLPSDLGKALQVQFALADDGQYNYATPTTGYANCYQVHFRANGSLELFKMTPSGAGPIVSSVSTPALTAGAFAHLKIAVTPTGFTITRTDTGSTPITSTDTAYRGGYISLTRYSLTDGVGMFRDLVIS